MVLDMVRSAVREKKQVILFELRIVLRAYICNAHECLQSVLAIKDKVKINDIISHTPRMTLLAIKMITGMCQEMTLHHTVLIEICKAHYPCYIAFLSHKYESPHGLQNRYIPFLQFV